MGEKAFEGTPPLPPGRMLDLRGRDPVWIYEAPGPRDAPVVMLLHGLGASAALNWFPSFGRLAQHFRVVAPDHRGHGHTPPGRETFRLEGCAADALAVADAVEAEHLIAVGYSMGGPIAQLMWRAQPSRVDGLVLAATSRDFGGRIRDRLTFQALPLALAGTRIPFSREMRRVALGLLAPRFASPELRRWAVEELRRADSRRILEAAIELGQFSSRGWIGRVDVPTSVIVAMHDQLVPVRRQLKLARSIRGSVAAFVDGDHYSAGRTPDSFVPVLLHECLSVALRATKSSDVVPAYWDEQVAAS